MTQDDQTWATQAACASVEPDQLFGKGAEQRDARSLCFSCPVRMECLAEALNSESSFGVWGGLTERERRALLRRFPEVDDWGLWLQREDDELVAEIHARRAPRILRQGVLSPADLERAAGVDLSERTADATGDGAEVGA